MKIDIDSPLDSYSLAAMARTEDILTFLISDLDIVGSKDAFKNILYGVRLIVKGKNRRLTDFSEIIKDNENGPNQSDNQNCFKINVFREDIIADVIGVIIESGFTSVKRIKDTTHLWIKIPEPTNY